VINGELQAAKMNGLTWSEADTSRVVAVGNEGEFWWCNHQNIQRKSTLQISLLGVPTFGVFFALAWYRVVKITHSGFEVVLQTTKHMVIYPGSSPSLEVIPYVQRFDIEDE
jgi:hypothetical protein